MDVQLLKFFLLVAMVLLCVSADAHIPAQGAIGEAVQQYLKWLRGTAQSISGQMERLLDGEGDATESLTLRGVCERAYSALWSSTGVESKGASSRASPSLKSAVGGSVLPLTSPSPEIDAVSLPLWSNAGGTVYLAEEAASLNKYFRNLDFSCRKGTFAVQSGVQFDCPGVGVVSSADYVKLSSDDRLFCHRVGDTEIRLHGSAESFGQTCICAPDFYMTSNEVKVACAARPLLLKMELNESLLCPLYDDRGSSRVVQHYPNDYCLEVQRGSQLSLEVKVRSSWGSDKVCDDAVFRTRWRSLPSPRLNSTSVWQTEKTSGSYVNLVQSIYRYTIPPMVVGNDFSFSVSSRNKLFSNLDKWSSIFSFEVPEDMVHTTHIEPVNGMDSDMFSTLFGGRDGSDGFGAYTLTYNLSDIRETSVERGQMYMETGFRGEELLFMDYAVARIHISLFNYSEPSIKTYSYKVGFNPAFIFLIVCACSIVMGVALTFSRAVYRRRQRDKAQSMTLGTVSSNPF